MPKACLHTAQQQLDPDPRRPSTTRTSSDSLLSPTETGFNAVPPRSGRHCWLLICTSSAPRITRHSNPVSTLPTTSPNYCILLPITGTTHSISHDSDSFGTPDTAEANAVRPPCMPHSRPAVRCSLGAPAHPYLLPYLPAFSQAYGIPFVL